jgi:hypothetical protein
MNAFLAVWIVLFPMTMGVMTFLWCLYEVAKGEDE